MTAGNPEPVAGHEDVYAVDTGMFDTAGYGAVYVIDAAEPTEIDTGTGANRDRIVDAVTAVGIGTDELSWIVPTHAHLDHAGGAGYLAEHYPNARIRTPERGVRHLIEPERLVAGTKAAVGDQWRHYAEPKPVPEDRIAGLSDGDSLHLGDRELVFRHAPGHAPHHGFYHDPDAGLVFTADAAGLYVPDRDAIRPTSPPPQFDLEQCLADVDAIVALEPETLCFAHFGPREFDRELLEDGKAAYVEWVDAVREARAELGDDDAVVADFEDRTDLADAWNGERARANAALNVRGVLAYLDGE